MSWITRLLFITFTIFTFFSHTVSHASNKADPHFYIQMENHSARDVSISFQPVTSNVSLTPILNNQTMLLTHQQSNKYGVVFNPLGRDDQFNIVFTGKKDCAFNVAFYAPYNPKITILGLGCFGGGYKMQGNTLILYISDINLTK